MGAHGVCRSMSLRAHTHNHSWLRRPKGGDPMGCGEHLFWRARGEALSGKYRLLRVATPIVLGCTTRIVRSVCVCV